MDYLRQIKARLMVEDGTLDQLMQPYAKTGRQSDVIRLALYLLFGAQPDELPESLAKLFAEFSTYTQVEGGGVSPTAATPDVHVHLPDDAPMAEALSNLADAVKTLAANPTPRPSNTNTIPSGRGKSQGQPNGMTEQQSGGIDMSAPRPRKKLKGTGKPTSLPEQLPELTEHDKVRLAKEMAASIFNFNPNRTTQ